MRNKSLSKCFIFVTLLAGTAIGLRAQGGGARLAGTVADSQGAVIQDAKILLINTKTGEARRAASNETGNFAVVNLQPAA